MQSVPHACPSKNNLVKISLYSKEAKQDIVKNIHKEYLKVTRIEAREECMANFALTLPAQAFVLPLSSEQHLGSSRLAEQYREY